MTSNTCNVYIKACKEIAKKIFHEGIKTRENINKIKIDYAKRFKLCKIPSNADIIEYAGEYREVIKDLLLQKPVRSISGIVIVALMSYPYECPHGRCIYCPHFPGVPVSYTGKEPSARRGIDNKFDPVLQIRKRIKQLEALGHSTDKIDIIIQGGTFNASPAKYREEFMLGILEAILGYRPKTYEEGIIAAEKAKYRIVGMAFETRPDQCSEDQIDWMLSKGATRVEIGVQTIYNDVYQFVSRGHDVKAVIEATRKLKDAALKVTYHIMPGLPLTTKSLDYQILEKIFRNPNYMPDHLKIYPTLVLNYTGLHKLWKMGRYMPLSTDEARILITAVKANTIPRWVRIMRVNRDIPSTEIIAGVNKPNLRQIIHEYMSKTGLICRCIRCREVGHAESKGKVVSEESIEFNVEKFYANKGIEYFISAEDVENDILIGFIRMRRPSKYAWREEIVNWESYLIRELHVYGRALPLGVKSKLSWQHRGIGEKLLSMAENIVATEGGEKIIIMSGIGVREYYYKLGYFCDGPYVSKFVK